MTGGQGPSWSAPRDLRPVNWRGFWTLYRRAALRYLRSLPEDVGGPLVSSMLFLIVFSMAWGAAGGEPIRGVDPVTFIAPGIAAYALFHGAFENSAFPTIHDKLEGIVQDVLGAPLTPLEMVAGYVLPAATGGLVTGAIILGVMRIFVEIPLAAPLYVLGFGVLGAMLFAFLGFLAGLWARKWDRYSVVDTFLILPLGLLSGTFFPLAALPEMGQSLILANPVFYAVDGFRAGFLGQPQAPLLAGAAVLLGLCALLAVTSWILVARGYRLKP